MKRNVLYSLTCLAFATMIGGAVYEHLNLVPAWAAAPPLSLSMFQGEYGLKAETFWKIIHPVNLLLFIASLVMHWKSARRKPIAIVLGSYVAILAVTAVYFVPELISIITTPFAPVADAALTARAQTWEALSLVRLGVLVLLALILFMGSTKDGTNNVGAIKRRKSVSQRSALLQEN